MDDQGYVNLLARCAIRDQNALKVLYDQTSSMLFRVAFNILQAEDLSNEVLQESYLQIWNHAGDYRQNTARPLTWMVSIVRYRALDKQAIEKKHRAVAGLETLEVIADKNRPELGTVELQNSRMFRDCLATLNERTRVSISLAYIKGYSREQIAAILATNSNTIKSWLHRGAERLRQCIERKSQ